MTESMMGEGWTLYGNEDVRDLQRRAHAVLRTIELLDALTSDLLWSDSCSIAESIQDVVEALGWQHEGLSSYILFGDHPDDLPIEGWSGERILTLLRRVAGGVGEHSVSQRAGDVPEHAVQIALQTLEGGLTNESALHVLDEVIRITSRFLYTEEGPARPLHPRVRATMDSIWAAASWVGNVPLEEADREMEPA